MSVARIAEVTIDPLYRVICPAHGLVGEEEHNLDARRVRREHWAADHDGTPLEATSVTALELRLLWMLAGDRTPAEIADLLAVGTDVVAEHLAGLFRKLGASGPAGAVHRAHRIGLLGMPVGMAAPQRLALATEWLREAETTGGAS